VDPKSLRSLEFVEQVVHDERTAQLSHLDALDTKAGVILGFAGAIVALSPSAASLWTALGKASAIVSAYFSIATFWPRRFWTLDVRALRERYLAAEPMFTRIHVLDTMIATARRNDETLARRGRQLKAAMIGLGLATLLIGVGGWLD